MPDTPDTSWRPPPHLRWGSPSRGYFAPMSRVSEARHAVRDAIRRHPWWTDSLLALFLTFISAGSVVAATHNAHGSVNPLDAVLVPVTTLPIALRRYRPIAVLAVTVAAETLLLV